MSVGAFVIQIWYGDFFFFFNYFIFYLGLNRVIFPGEVSPSDSSMSGKEKQEYLQEIERIRSEIAGFQPIANKEDTWKLRHDDESVESDCEELGGPEEFF